MATTGETVMHCQNAFNDECRLAFQEVTVALKAAIINQQLEKAQMALAKNHALLQQIGATPRKVAQFIDDCAQIGLYGKICGAGSSTGDNGGMVLLLGNDIDHQLHHLCKKYCFQIYPIALDNGGCHVVQS